MGGWNPSPYDHPDLILTKQFTSLEVKNKILEKFNAIQIEA
jgi:hypothetical protein